MRTYSEAYVEKVRMDVRRLKDENFNLRERLESLDSESAKAKLAAAKARARELEESLRKANATIVEKDAIIAALRRENELLKAPVRQKDSSNSSIPTSAENIFTKGKVISNSRVKTGRKPGAQPGHKGHGRNASFSSGTTVVEIPPTDGMASDPDLHPTGSFASRISMGLRVSVDIVEYRTRIYRRKDGTRVHAPFPAWCTNEVNYDPSVMALALYLNGTCKVPVVQVSELLSAMTGGEIAPSVGFISGLPRKFSALTEAERTAMFNRLVRSKVLYTDFTVNRVCGENRNVLVVTDKKDTLYFEREKKGHEGVKGSPVEVSEGILVHDHDTTFYSYGSQHQECLAHLSRYAQNSIELEPEKEWPKKLKEFLGKAIHEHREAGGKLDDGTLAALTKEFKDILRLGSREHLSDDDSIQNTETRRLLNRLWNYEENVLLFLGRDDVDPSNNVSERKLRAFKRKLKMQMCFRSSDAAAYYCDYLSMVQYYKANKRNILKSIEERFSMPN